MLHYRGLQHLLVRCSWCPALSTRRMCSSASSTPQDARGNALLSVLPVSRPNDAWPTTQAYLYGFRWCVSAGTTSTLCTTNTTWCSPGVRFSKGEGHLPASHRFSPPVRVWQPAVGSTPSRMHSQLPARRGRAFPWRVALSRSLYPCHLSPPCAGPLPPALGRPPALLLDVHVRLDGAAHRGAQWARGVVGSEQLDAARRRLPRRRRRRHP